MNQENIIRTNEYFYNRTVGNLICAQELFIINGPFCFFVVFILFYDFVLSISGIFQHIFFLFSQAFFFYRLFSILICILCKFTCVIFCSLLLSLLLYESINPQAQLLKTCSIGKQQFWVLLTVHMRVGFF